MDLIDERHFKIQARTRFDFLWLVPVCVPDPIQSGVLVQGLVEPGIDGGLNFAKPGDEHILRLRDEEYRSGEVHENRKK
jgi:hypothetical protein